MKAVIMAGGQGTRLRPLTNSLPKPMARLCGRPMIEYIIELLAANGIHESILTLQYLPQVITTHFQSREYAGVKLEFCEEPYPLGTAGSVKNAVQSATEPVLVISGDALCDFSLRSAVKQHESLGSMVTIVSARVADPREYGLVITDETGMVTGFVEKPSFAQATSELANTGIYILSPEVIDMIPDGEKYDFASDLFPRLLREGYTIANCTLEGYWCDIGDLDAYRQAAADILYKKVQCHVHGDIDADGNIYAGKKPGAKYELEPPVYIGAGVHIGDHAVIGAGSILDDGCTIAKSATIDGAVLLPHSSVGEHAGLMASILCDGAAVKSRATLFEGVAVGEGAVIGRGAVVQPGMRITAAAQIPDSAIVNDHVHTRKGVPNTFDDDGICGEIGVELTPELAVRMGCAIGTAAARGAVGVSCENERSAKVLSDALIAGIRSTGSGVTDFGAMFRSMFQFAMGYNALQIGVYVSCEQGGAINIVCEAGLPATRKLERSVEIALARGEFTRAPKDGFGEYLDMTGLGAIYLTDLLRISPEGLSGISAQVVCDNSAVARTLQDALQKLGCDISGGISLHLSNDGTAVSLRQGDIKISGQRAVAAFCMAMFDQQKDVAVENDFPRAIDELAKQYGRQVYRYLLCPADDSDEQSRKIAAKQQTTRDGLMLSIALLDFMRRKEMTLAQLDQMVPPLAVDHRTVEVNIPPAKLLETFTQERTGEGVVVRRESGVILLRPRKNGSAIRVFAEAANWETAQELCADITGELRALLDKKQREE